MPTPLTIAPDRIVWLPSGWPELTLRQAQRLAATPTHDEYGFIGCLLGLTRIEVMNLPAAGLVDIITPALAWASTPPALADLPRPATITLPRGSNDNAPLGVAVPESLGMETFGQAVDLGNALQQLIDDVPALRIRALAIYLYPRWSGLPYDSDAIAGFEQLVADVTLAEAQPLTDFFLLSTSRSAPPTPTASNTSPSPQPSARPAPSPSPSGGSRWPSWMRWPRGTKQSGTSSSASRGQRSTR